MGTLTKNFAKLGAVFAISGLALVGCSATTDGTEPSKPSSSQEQRAEKATPETAAKFSNEFFAELIKEDTTDYGKLTPPVELTDEQAEQLMLDGKVDGVSDEKLDELMDFLYENQPLGKYIYFSEDATIQERLQAISALILAQNFATEMAKDQTPEKITAEQVSIEKNDGATVAIIETDGSTLAPALIFVDGEWRVSGSALLESFGASAAVPSPEDSAPSE